MVEKIILAMYETNRMFPIVIIFIVSLRNAGGNNFT